MLPLHPHFFESVPNPLGMGGKHNSGKGGGGPWIPWIPWPYPNRGAGSLERFRDQRFSLADAVSFEVMSRDGLEQAFAFDRRFRTAGFEMLA